MQPLTHAGNTCANSCASYQDIGPGTTPATVSLAGSWILTEGLALKVYNACMYECMHACIYICTVLV